MFLSVTSMSKSLVWTGHATSCKIPTCATNGLNTTRAAKNVAHSDIFVKLAAEVSSLYKFH